MGESGALILPLAIGTAFGCGAVWVAVKVVEFFL